MQSTTVDIEEEDREERIETDRRHNPRPQATQWSIAAIIGKVRRCSLSPTAGALCARPTRVRYTRVPRITLAEPAEPTKPATPATPATEAPPAVGHFSGGDWKEGLDYNGFLRDIVV